jgi:hypothetical protein
MKINLQEISVKDVVNGYADNNEDGVVGYNGLLNIRPKYQREFVYKDAQRDAVLDTLRKNLPLNVLYWVKNSDSTFEVLDGQQRTISICQYITGKYSINYKYFHNLEPEEQQQILDYKLMVYVCEGTNKEKLEWFKTINISGVKLTNQELLNTVYTGEWLSDAKKNFSKTNCPAWSIAKDYLTGSPIRQEYLETVLDWISGGNIEDYMSKSYNLPNANNLWLYFNNIINWVKATFVVYRKEMKGVNFGILYDKHGKDIIDTKKLETEIKDLLQNEDVTKKSGVFGYVLTRDVRYLNLRTFTDKQKTEMYEAQNGICNACEKHFELSEMEADHIIPFSQGGKTTITNCQMLCKKCNRIKSNK